jgi:hypothetical protein
MNERTDQPEAAAAPSRRGEAAWKAEKESIAARNEKAKRAGRQVREEQEKRRIQDRRAEELRERAAMAEVLKPRR